MGTPPTSARGPGLDPSPAAAPASPPAGSLPMGPELYFLDYREAVLSRVCGSPGHSPPEQSMAHQVLEKRQLRERICRMAEWLEAWMNPGNILTERSRTQKAVYYTTPLTRKVHERPLHRDGRRFGLARGWGRGRASCCNIRLCGRLHWGVPSAPRTKGDAESNDAPRDPVNATADTWVLGACAFLLSAEEASASFTARCSWGQPWLVVAQCPWGATVSHPRLVLLSNGIKMS